MALIFRFANVALHKQRKELPMKNVTIALLIVVSAGSLNTAQVAQAGEVVSFRLKAAELQSTEGREKLLVRMRSNASAACSAQSYSYYSDRIACKKHLQAQWIDAIGNPALADLARKGKDKLASASN
jgi:UrcA family protein